MKDSTKKCVTALIGSGRKERGLTYRATRQLLDNLESYGGVRTEIVFLSDYEFGLCRGCKVCFMRGEEHCPLKGDRDLLIEKMLASDGIVLASPNYSFHVSSIMKAFLDRLGYVFHRPVFFGKAFTSITVQGFLGGKEIEKYFRLFGKCLYCNVVKGSCITALEPPTAKDLQKMNEALARQSRLLYAQLSKPPQLAPSLFNLMGFRMGRTCIKQTLPEDARDYIHYRDRGWLESDYFYSVSLGPFKRALGAIFDRIFARVYKRPAPAPRPAELRAASPDAVEADRGRAEAVGKLAS